MKETNIDATAEPLRVPGDPFMEKKRKALGQESIVGAPFKELVNAQKYITAFQADANRPGSPLVALQGGRAATTSIWIDADTINHFAKLITDKKSNGVRLYFAKYDPDVEDPMRPTGPDYDNKYMVVMVATAPKEVGGKIINEDRIVHPATKNDPYEGLYNYNDLCPPLHCDGATILNVLPPPKP